MKGDDENRHNHTARSPSLRHQDLQELHGPSLDAAGCLGLKSLEG